MQVNRDRLFNDFVQLVGIDSISLRERKMCDTLISMLRELGYSPIEDDAGEKAGGDCGNVICTVSGTKDVPTILFAAHMDTVQPGIGKKAIISGDKIKSDGKTVLGGDDAAGIAAILEALRIIKENNIQHGDIQVVFTIGEEIGLLGSKNLDYSKLHSKYGFIIDSDGEVGCAAVRAPFHNKIHVTIHGKAAHAGIEPEKGISAVSIMAEAVSNMKLGRIDQETTANIGLISGGTATNVVCAKLDLDCEARSLNQSKLDEQTAHMKKCFEDAAVKFGGSVDFAAELEYPGYEISEKDELLKILEKACTKSGLAFKPVSTGGGSDTNNFNSRGIKAVDLSIGMSKIHSIEEEILIEDIVKTSSLIVSIVESV